MASLITAVRSKLLQAIRSVNPPGRWKILVVDEHSQKLLGSVLKQFDILEENVTLIESISSHREPQQFEAVYLLMPTTQNVNRIIKDFSDGRQQYLGAHLFFVDGLSETLFEHLTTSPAEPHLKGLQDLFVNFRGCLRMQRPRRKLSLFSHQDCSLTLLAHHEMKLQFKSARLKLEEELRFVSKTIANVCITLNEFPYVRYYMPTHHTPLGPLKPNDQTRAPPPPEGSGRWRTNLARGDAARAYEVADTDFVTKLLAFMIQQNLDEYRRVNPEFPKASDPPRPRGTLIITDRSMDTVAPFIHEFTYQAMCNDLLQIDDGTKYMYKFQSSVGSYEDKIATLSDADSVWTTRMQAFKGEGAASLNDMKDMLANLPQYQEQREKFSLHLNMAQDCMNLFEKHKLPLVANVEQCCATGLTAEGKTPKTLVEEMVPLLDSQEVINANKVRMVALYIQHRDGVPDEDRRRLYQHARLSMTDQDAVNSLVHLGVRISRGPSDKDTKKKLKQKTSSDDEYELSRYRPLLRTVIEEHCTNKLDPTLFPYVKDSPIVLSPAASLKQTTPQTTSLRSAKPSWHKAVRPNALAESKQRVIVFVVGGMTYSEIRETYSLSTLLNKDIYIGSTHAITPRNFIDDLKVLEIAGVGSRAVPNGVSLATAHNTYQEYYDEKYFTPDPPVPQRPTLSVPKDSKHSANKLTKTPSSYSTSSASLVGSGTVEKEEKKKKKGLFRF
ncbi:Sec1-like protein [Suillus fuscotomentosus]|uniref:Sec1-like protein n=1 Tax=Suillus fuscotomentosus TaxID=1912939 RepID=A0AAD4EMM9_9AGAM|nr:Sec1-like protein [Suillus fuscotomentosus]KAG1907804.1 Sec1-like protein [Suillus fuscotomentosus]